MVQVRLPNSEILEVEEGTTVKDLLPRLFSKKKAKKALLARIDGELKDLSHPIQAPCSLEILFEGDEEALETLRHSASHLLAQAVQELYPGTKLAIGPAIDNGFYYDLDIPQKVSEEDLPKIEEKMQKLADASMPLERVEMDMAEAKRFFQEKGESYKVELLEDLEREGAQGVSLYRQGEFWDLCRGPHVPATNAVKVFKLTSLAGAYWKGDASRPMLTRIYGTAFFSKKELKEHLARIEEAKKRDHRRLGKELDLFSIQDATGPGLILWHPRGGLIRKCIEDFWRDEHLKRGYDILFTPHIARLDLWKTSGHLDFYSENMYSPMEIDDVLYQLKPMNCPFHIAVYNSSLRSYRELPLRWCELGTVYRYEMTGTLHGLMRVRGFTQDDAHVFCRPDQLQSEISSILDMTLYMLRVFGFDRYDVYLSTRPDKFVGSEKNWERATSALESALQAQGLEYEIDPGEGVFYGPKIDIKIRDSLDRSWQCSTIQVDFNLPERFEVKYIGEDGQPHTPIMVHRALLGSIERFFGVLIEHYGGAFPVWLAPVQALVLTVTDRHAQWAGEVVSILRQRGFRVEADLRNEKLGKKIREAQLQKIPYMLVVGDREVEEQTVAPRSRTGETLESCGVEEFATRLQEELEAPFKAALNTK